MPGDAVTWRGLWHHRPRPWRDELATHVVLYLVTPLAIALIGTGGEHLAERVPRAYCNALIIGSAIAGTFELQYRLLWPRLVRTQPGWPARIALQAVAIAFAVAIGTSVAALAFRAIWGLPVAWFMTQVWPTSLAVSITAIGVLAVVDELTARRLIAERQAAAARVAALRAELGALQARTDPHFLFNTLNTIASLIPDDPGLAERTLERLADVFRYALDAGRRVRVPLGDELRAVAAYLDVEAARLGTRLRWSIACPPELEGVAVPPLAIQPLAENAVRHGAERRRGATTLTIAARRDGDQLQLTVDDQPVDGVSAPAGPPRPGAGTALAELAARLALAAGDHARLDAGPCPPAGWRATLRVPVDDTPRGPAT